MKNTAILTALAMSAVSVFAGTAPAPAPSGKGTTHPSPSDPCAGPISYNNIEALYLYTDIDGGDSYDGIGARIEYSPMQNLYLTVGGSWNDGDRMEDSNLSVGLGGYLPLTENIHAVVEGGALWINREFEGYGILDNVDGDDWGWYVRPHLRAKFGCLEIHAGAQYVDVSGSDGVIDPNVTAAVVRYGAWEVEEWSGFANLYYQVAPGWDLTAGVTFAEDRTTFGGGVRYRF
jgi:hypothetical protein